MSAGVEPTVRRWGDPLNEGVGRLDRLYQRITTDLDALWRALGLQRAA